MFDPTTLLFNNDVCECVGDGNTAFLTMPHSTSPVLWAEAVCSHGIGDRQEMNVFPPSCTYMPMASMISIIVKQWAENPKLMLHVNGWVLNGMTDHSVMIRAVPGEDGGCVILWDRCPEDELLKSGEVQVKFHCALYVKEWFQMVETFTAPLME